MKEIKNMKEFLALIDKYKSITAKDIEDAMGKDKNPNAPRNYKVTNAMFTLTGFNSNRHCTLCQPCEVVDYWEDGTVADSNVNCEFCAHMVLDGLRCYDQRTYIDMQEATTIDEMLHAIANRIYTMELMLIDYTGEYPWEAE